MAMEMNKHQLIEGIIHDLGDENAGVQVRGYRNMNIIRTIIEALTALNQGLARDDEMNAELIKKKDARIEELEARLAALEGTSEGMEIEADLEEAAEKEDADGD